jgi:hypothetical protein
MCKWCCLAMFVPPQTPHIESNLDGTICGAMKAMHLTSYHVAKLASKSGGANTTTDTHLLQRMDMYLNANIGVASAFTNGFSMRCIFGCCKDVTQRIYVRW